MKKIITFFIVGTLVGTIFWLLTNNTILFDALESKTFDGFFYLREPDGLESALNDPPNRYVSDQVRLVAIDNESLGVLGKWPWYRDVHADYLQTVQKFSPRAVYFDVAFIMPEKIPSSLTSQLADEPEKLEEITTAFKAMDNSFAQALRDSDNVYMDLFLVGEKRADIPYRDRILDTERIMERYSIPAPEEEPIYYYSLEPLVKEFMENAQPVTVNQWPDRDSAIRSFLLTHPYENAAGEKRHLFSAVLALLMEYYHIEDKSRITIEEDRVILHRAWAPALDENRRTLVAKNLDFGTIREKIITAPTSTAYNRNIFNHAVNEYRIERPDDSDKRPRYPLHLLKKQDGGFLLIDGREIFDAALELDSQRVDVIFYTEEDVVINTEKNFFGVSHVLPINFAGRQEIPYPDPATGKKVIHSTIPKEKYIKVVEAESIPDIPETTADGAMDPTYDTGPLAEWFYGYCDRQNNTALLAVQENYGNLTNENVFQYIGEDNPGAGKYVYYKMFFDDIHSLIQTGDLPAPANFEEMLAIYPEWLNMNGLAQDEIFRLNLSQPLAALQEAYGEQLDKFYNKIVFTGAYSAGMADDIKVTPYGSMFGVNVIINAFNTVITDNQLTRSPTGLNNSLLFGLCLVLALIYGLLNIRINFYIFLLSLLVTYATSFILFAFHNYILQTTPLVLANIGVFISLTVIRVLTEEKDKKFLKSTFSQYISPELINTMYESKALPELGGSSDIITAYFTDIQGFSTFSEKMTAPQLVDLLNEYLTEMTDILLAEQGTLDKYEGDAIIAFFGAPLRFEDHALRGCRVAITMQDRLLELKKKWQNDKSAENRNTKGVPEEDWAPGDRWPMVVHDMRMRIGINTGEIVTGNMGSKTRKNYTMMGDSVNLAARLEAGAKQYGIFTIISEYTFHHEFTDEKGQKNRVADFVEVRFIDNIMVVGKSEPVKVYELAAMQGGLTEKEQTLFELFGAAMELYLAMEWDEAIEKFKAAEVHERFPEAPTTPSTVYIKRCREFRENPPIAPGEQWDGVYRLTSK